MEQTMKDAREWALKIAEWGVPVFPLWGVKDGIDLRTGLHASHEDGSGKKPKTGGADWREYATTIRERIEEWFDDDPDINYGCVLGNGFLVVDCDSIDASERFEDVYLQYENDAPDTFTVITGQGVHYWFRGNSRSFKFAPDVDLKAAGGYVVGPGSTSWTGTSYRVYNEAHTELYQAPAWITQKIVERRENDGTWEYFFTRAGGRNNALRDVAGHAVGLGLPPEVVRGLLDLVNEHCFDEPLSRSEIDTTIGRSFLSWEPGSRLQDQVDAELWIDSYKVESKYFTYTRHRRMRGSPRWLYEGLVPEYGICQLYGPTYSGKSFVAIDLAMSYCNGLDWMGFRLNPDGKGKVLYVLAEGAWGFQDRLDAWAIARGLDPDEASSRLITVEEQGNDLTTIEGWAEIYHQSREDEEVMADWDKIGLVVLDTQSLLLQSANENDNSEMNKAMGAAKIASRAYHCPVLFVHHTGHNGERARGASSVGAALDVVIGIKGLGEVKELVVDKVKAAKKPDGSRVFQLSDLLYQEGQDEPVRLPSARVERLLGTSRMEALIEALQASDDGFQLKPWCDANGVSGGTLTRFYDAVNDDPRVEVTRGVRNSIWVRLSVPEE